MHESSRSTLSPSLREKKWLIFVSCQGRVKKKKERIFLLSPRNCRSGREKKKRKKIIFVCPHLLQRVGWWHGEPIPQIPLPFPEPCEIRRQHERREPRRSRARKQPLDKLSVAEHVELKRRNSKVRSGKNGL